MPRTSRFDRKRALLLLGSKTKPIQKLSNHSNEQPNIKSAEQNKSHNIASSTPYFKPENYISLQRTTQNLYEKQTMKVCFRIYSDDLVFSESTQKLQGSNIQQKDFIFDDDNDNDTPFTQVKYDAGRGYKSLCEALRQHKKEQQKAHRRKDSQKLIGKFEEQNVNELSGYQKEGKQRKQILESNLMGVSGI